MCDSSAGDRVDNRGGHWETPVWVRSSVPGAWMRVTAGMSIRNSSLFIEVRNLSRYEGQLRNVN